MDLRPEGRPDGRSCREQILGDEVSLAGDDDFEALFEHVTSCFERAVDAETCARTWRLHRAVLGA